MALITTVHQCWIFGISYVKLLAYNMSVWYVNGKLVEIIIEEKFKTIMYWADSQQFLWTVSAYKKEWYHNPHEVQT
jgi:hypothetical protein